MKTVDTPISKELTRLILNTRKGITVEKTDLRKLTFVAQSEEGVKYGIATRYRNIPETETCSQVFEFDDLKELKIVCEENDLIPVIAFTLYNTDKVRIFLFKVSQLEELAESSEICEPIEKVEKGLQLKYGFNKTTDENMLKSLSTYLDCTVLEPNGNDFTKK